MSWPESHESLVGIHGDDLAIKVGKETLVFANDLGLKDVFAFTRHFNVHRVTVGDDVIGAAAVAAVGTSKETEASRSQWWINSPTRSKIIDNARAQAFSGRKLTDPAVLLSQEPKVNKLTPSELIREVRLGSKAAAYRCQFTTECRSLAIIDGKLRGVVLGGAIDFLKQQAKAGNKNAEKDVCLILPLAEQNAAWGIGIGREVCSQAVKEFPNSEIMRMDLDILTRLS